MKRLRKWWLRLFPTYRIIERRFLSYSDANTLILEGELIGHNWEIDTQLENANHITGFVFLCRRERITE